MLPIVFDKLQELSSSMTHHICNWVHVGTHWTQECTAQQFPFRVKPSSIMVPGGVPLSLGVAGMSATELLGPRWQMRIAQLVPECPWLHQIFTPMVIVIKLRLVILDNILPWFATRRMPNIVPLCWNHKKSQCASRCKLEFPNIPIDMQNQRIWNTYRYAFQIRWCSLLFLESWKNRSGSRCALWFLWFHNFGMSTTHEFT